MSKERRQTKMHVAVWQFGRIYFVTIFIIYILSIALVAYVVWALVLFFMQPKFVFRPIRDVCYTPGELGLDYEDVPFSAADGVKLHGWYVPAEDAHFPVLFCHGNGGNVAHRLDALDIFNRMGLNCFVFDYRGYGKSEGKPGEQGTYADARAACDWLQSHKKVPPDRIIILGKSLGASIAAHLAAERPARGLVLESGFTSYVDMGRRYYPYMPVRWFARFRYDTIGHIRRVKCPVLVLHSRDDTVVPFEFGRQLYEAAGEPKQFVELTGGHNDAFLVCAELYENAWCKWLAFLESGPPE